MYLTGLVIAGLLAVLAASPGRSLAQTSPQSWPQWLVKFIVPFGSGAGDDIGARPLVERPAGEVKLGKVRPRAVGVVPCGHLRLDRRSGLAGCCAPAARGQAAAEAPRRVRKERRRMASPPIR
jgi:hypothetical protein